MSVTTEAIIVSGIILGIWGWIVYTLYKEEE